MAKSKKVKAKKAPVARWAKGLPKLMGDFKKAQKALEKCADELSGIDGIHDYDYEDTQQYTALKCLASMVSQASQVSVNAIEAIQELGLEDMAMMPLPVEPDPDEQSEPAPKKDIYR